MQISIFTDEINRENPERAIRLASEWGVNGVEVRTLPGGRFPSVSDAEMDEFYTLVKDAGLDVSGVSPGFCKCSIDDPSVPGAISEGLPRACEWAKRWGTDMVSCFAFDRDESETVPDAVVDAVGRMAEIAGQHGCRLLLENESSCWGGTGLEAVDIIRRIGSPNLTLCWDPGNSARAGAPVPFPDEYEQLKDLVTHVHMKNFDTKNQEWSLIEDGIVDWQGQIAALESDGYDGFIVIETHRSVSPDEFKFVDSDLDGLEANTYRNLNYIRSLVE